MVILGLWEKRMDKKQWFKSIAFSVLMPLLFCVCLSSCDNDKKGIFSRTDEVDYVNVQMGLYDLGAGVENQPIIQLPNKLLRIKPLRESYRSTAISGLPLFSPLEHNKSIITLLPYDKTLLRVDTLDNEIDYDSEVITPYSYQIYMDNLGIHSDFTLSSLCGLYRFSYDKDKYEASEEKSILLVADSLCEFSVDQGGAISGICKVSPEHSTKVYFYIECAEDLVRYEHIPNVQLRNSVCDGERAQILKMTYSGNLSRLRLRYAISLISIEQAKRNLAGEMQSYEYIAGTKAARNEWQKVLRKIQVEGGTTADMTKFYTALYRSYLWPISIVENNRYYSPVLDSVLSVSPQQQIYVLDNTLYSYETTHPLHLLLSPDLELQVLASHLNLLDQERGQVHTNTTLFSPIQYNKSSYLLQIFLDAQAKGMLDLDSRRGFEYIKSYTLDPSMDASNYDLWCLGRWASLLGLGREADKFFKMAQSKEQRGALQAEDIEHLLANNDGATYPAAISYVGKADRLLSDFYGKTNITPDFFAYLFSYTMAGRPKQAQKNVRIIIDRYFSSFYLGVPGEDRYGALSSSLVFAMMGIYPIAPGFNAYIIGAPVFSKIKIDMGSGRHFEIMAPGASSTNKYVVNSVLNGRPLHQCWFKHSDIAQGGKILITLTDH